MIFLKWKCNTQKKSTKSTLTFLDLQKLQHFGLWLTSKFAISLCLLWYALIQGKNLFLSKIFCTTFWSFLQVLWMLWIRKSCQNIFETFYQYALCENLTIFYRFRFYVKSILVTLVLKKLSLVLKFLDFDIYEFYKFLAEKFVNLWTVFKKEINNLFNFYKCHFDNWCTL